MEENISIVIATPAARALAAERNIDLRGLRGSGEFDSVTKADVQAIPLQKDTVIRAESDFLKMLRDFIEDPDKLFNN